MSFTEKSNLDEIRKQRDIRAYEYNKYRGRFFTSTIAVILTVIFLLSNNNTTKVPEPSQNDIVSAASLSTIEGREAAINEKYDGASITKERTYGKDIISVFEVDDMYSFCIFEAIEDGYWMEYCGSLFPKTDMVKGTVYLGDNTHKYDIYLQGNVPYTHLLIDRTNMTQPHNSEQQQIRFDENGIALMKLDPEIHDPAPRIVAYDAEGNEFLLADGTL